MFQPCCEQSGYKMSTAQNVILRVAIVLGMMVAVVAILYLTPLPEQHFKSCDRPCHDLDWPMICRVKLEIASLETAESTLNLTNRKEVITVNRQIPGPSIQICQNDVLVVDIINKIPGHSLTVHWRGQPNNEAPYMDGVPLITQCPIPSYTTFQYKFRASSPGTHLYHGFSDKDRADGFFGALIVRQPDKFEPQRKHYDVDSERHVVMISEASGVVSINGKTGADLPIFSVKRNKRYRFRMGYTSGKCPVRVGIDGHLLHIIALDGGPVGPSEARSVVLGKGERVDFVVKTNRNSGAYFLRVKSCDGNGLALINYEGNRRGSDDGDKELKNDEGSFDTALCESRVGRVCLDGVKSVEKIPERLREQPEKVAYLSFGSRTVNVNGEFSSRVYSINNLTFSYPPSPLLTQLDKIPPNSVCDGANVPEKCLGAPICECVHVEFVPLGASTEIVLINQDASDEEHVFHLHGYSFYIVGFRQFDEVPVGEEIKLLDQQDVLFKRNFNNPILKDTVRVPRNGAVALRFLADNPGFWMLRDEKSKGWTRGMDVVFQVGDPTEMVSAPTDFPTCGNYIGPDFFLM